MKRPRIEKAKKVRVNITIDEDIFIKSGDYIYNLSAFVNSAIKSYIDKKEKEFEEQVKSHNMKLCYQNEKRTSTNEVLNPEVQWWDN